MNVLLDTCTFLWLNLDAAELTRVARDIILDTGNQLYLSAVSVSEITVKHMAGRLHLPERPADYICSRRALNGILSLPLDEDSVFQLPKLPGIHSDPFDRMLICQAIAHGMPILTPDQHISAYPIRTIW